MRQLGAGGPPPSGSRPLGGGSSRSGIEQTQLPDQRISKGPRLYQAMEILQASVPELQARIREQMLENPFLEAEEPDENEELSEVEEEEEPTEDDDLDWESLMLDGLDGRRLRRSHAGDFYESPVVETPTLHDILTDQAGLADLAEREVWIAGEIIGNIGDDGLLACSLEAVADGLNERAAQTLADLGARLRDHPERGPADEEERPASAKARPEPLAERLRALAEDDEAEAEEVAGIQRLCAQYVPDEVAKVLAIIQTFDPPGVGARDLRECLLIQLARQGRGESFTARVVRDHLEDLLNRSWRRMAQALDAPLARLQEAADEVSQLDPRPGSRHASPPDQTVAPDLFVELVGDDYEVFANERGIPRLRIARSYREYAADPSRLQPRDGGGADGGRDAREFVESRVSAARWLIQMIEQRRQTLVKVMRSIVAKQRAFLHHGVQRLAPLTMNEVAREVGVAESTVSRAVQGKHVETPLGVYPVRFFFSAGLATATGSAISSHGVLAKIRSLVQDEDPRRPLTDQDLTRLLKSDGVAVARRTVAKYRDRLNILPARMRQRVD